MPSRISDFHPEAAGQKRVDELHEKIDELHGKFDALLALLTPKADEPKNESPAGPA